MDTPPIPNNKNNTNEKDNKKTSRSSLEGLTLVSYKNGEIVYQYHLNKSKILIGSFAHADISISESHISEYHAFIMLESTTSGKIIDLGSVNGIFINGEKIQTGSFTQGDRIRIGALEFLAVANDIGEIKDSDQSKVETLATNAFDELAPELPPLPGLILIDNEYCDINFQESYIPKGELELQTISIPKEAFIDVSEINEKELPNILTENISKDGTKSEAVEVIVQASGVIISLTHLDLTKDRTYHLTGSELKREIFLPILDPKEKFPFIKISKGAAYLASVEGFDNLKHKIEKEYKLDRKEIICYQKGVIEVFVRLVDAPPQIKTAPFFQGDKDYWKLYLKTVPPIVVLSILLVFLLPDPPKPEEKKVAVIYREAPKAPQQDTLSKDEAPAPATTPEVKEIPQKTVVEKTPIKKEVTKAPMPTPTKPVPTPVEPPKKKFQLSLDSSVKTIFSQTAAESSDTKAAVEASAAPVPTNAIDATAGVAGSGLRQVSKVGNGKQNDTFSGYGTSGIAKRTGVETAYVEPKTVVLGSMDPDLLRKILREYLPQFKHCYQIELQTNEDVKGVLDLNFRIDKDGKVSDASISSKNAQFSQQGINCMTKVLRMIDFPKPKGGGVVDVKQPLNFQSEKTKIN